MRKLFVDDNLVLCRCIWETLLNRFVMFTGAALLATSSASFTYCIYFIQLLLNLSLRHFEFLSVWISSRRGFTNST